jgi:hypothetical protein
LIRVTLGSDYQIVAPGGEIKHGTLGEEVATAGLNTRGTILGIDRRDLINDDLGVFNSIAELLGRGGARAQSDSFTTGLLANLDADGVQFFSTGHNNLTTGAGSVLTIGSVCDAIGALRQMKDGSGRTLDLQPAALVVPSELEQVARAIVVSNEIAAFVDSSIPAAPTGNALKGRLTVVCEPRLSNPVYGANKSAKAWYLCCAPADGAITASFLQGIETPTVESDGGDFETLGMRWRGYTDYSFDLTDFRAIRMMAGE